MYREMSKLALAESLFSYIFVILVYSNGVGVALR